MNLKAIIAKLEERTDEKLRPQPSREYTTLNDFVQSFAGGEIPREELPLHPAAYRQHLRLLASLLVSTDPAALAQGVAMAKRRGLTDAAMSAVKRWASSEGTAGSATVEVTTDRTEYDDRRCTITRTVTIKSIP